MSEAGNPLTEEQHRLFAEELASIKAQLEAFRVALAHRYGEEMNAATSLAQSIETLGEVEQQMQACASNDLPDIEDDIYGQEG